MPRGLYCDRPEHVVYREYDDPPLQAGQYRMRAQFGAIKHGTEFHLFSGHSPFRDRWFDQGLRLFMPRDPGDIAQFHGYFVGNIVVGTVTETAPDVSGVRVGDRVWAYAPLCETVTGRAADANLLEEGVEPTDAVCMDPGFYAFGAVRDGRIALGDNVVLFGLGAIGQMAVQLLRCAGCGSVIVVDPVQRRREQALALGADAALDPAGADVALTVRQRLGRGADVAVEASGSYAALHEAIRSVGQCGRVVTIGYYRGRDSQLELGADFFHNRVELIASLPAWGNPLHDAPVWDEPRVIRTLTAMFKAGRIASEGIVDPIVPFDDALEAFMTAYHDPASAIKLGVRLPNGQD